MSTENSVPWKLSHFDCVVSCKQHSDSILSVLYRAPIKDSVDCNLYFFGDKVGLGNMYVVLIASIVIAIGLYVGMNLLLGKRRR